MCWMSLWVGRVMLMESKRYHLPGTHIDREYQMYPDSMASMARIPGALLITHKQNTNNDITKKND